MKVELNWRLELEICNPHSLLSASCPVMDEMEVEVRNLTSSYPLVEEMEVEVRNSTSSNNLSLTLIWNPVKVDMLPICSCVEGTYFVNGCREALLG